MYKFHHQSSNSVWFRPLGLFHILDSAGPSNISLVCPHFVFSLVCNLEAYMVFCLDAFWSHDHTNSSCRFQWWWRCFPSVACCGCLHFNYGLEVNILQVASEVPPLLLLISWFVMTWVSVFRIHIVMMVWSVFCRISIWFLFGLSSEESGLSSKESF